MESISRATQTTGLASIETGPQPQPLFVEPQTLTTKHVKSNTALSKIDPKNMKIQTRQPVNAKNSRAEKPDKSDRTAGNRRA